MDLANVVDILLENPVKEILKLQEIVERNMDRCPWGSQQTIEDALKELISEIEEFEAELDVKNWTKAFFEVGDIVYDALLLAWIYAREHDVTPDTILRKVNNKISKRKPWLFSETRISLEEAKKLWNYYKSLES
ncbi:hypothetical protein IX53_03630 [Kosmotoga pacifica]|uniref:NTP pyrophosphohydrolase MazG-like domain-containing protein n=2 Tax=Kosmotoga pacifica TaxID=1330330 RepID=A0A0G2Z9J5_9BACT|nr:hypothetical protein IX53_03630 [Kosmotoga pacifica]